MTRTLQIPANARDTVWVFALDLPPPEDEAFVEDAGRADWPLIAGLGAKTLIASHVESFPAGDLGAIGLSGYLVEGLGIAAADIAADRDRLDAATGRIVIVHAAAFGGAAQNLSPQPPLRHLGTYRQIPTDQRLVPLPGTSAEPVIVPPPAPGPAPQLPRTGWRGLLGLLAAALVVLVLAYLMSETTP